MPIDMSSTATLACEPTPAKRDRNVWQAIKNGLAGKCPNCSKGKIFYRYLKVNDRCPECGEEFFHHRADDAPPYVTIVIVCHVVGTGILTVDTFAPELPMIYHLIFWPILTLALCLTCLPTSKGALIALQWALRMHGFETASAATHTPLEHGGEARSAL